MSKDRDCTMSQGNKTATFGFIDALHRNNEEIRITPLGLDSRCQCKNAFTVHRSSILEIDQTGETGDCCGENRDVYRIVFNDRHVDSTRRMNPNLSQNKGRRIQQGFQSQLRHSGQYQGYTPLPISSNGYGQYADSYNPVATNLVPPPIPSPRDSCETRWERCNDRCYNLPTLPQFLQCMCNCRNSYCFCSRTCWPEQCSAGAD